ncbi:ribbon-helix-helix domain-containing protein [Pseudoroseomonas ludipueritiae]|uniref:ribbon-helix-helix domain-containing protein n=2 Tax=Pseudoroseomonas ludipueritiae TaxID=198093 RepID=UPI003462DF2E
MHLLAESTKFHRPSRDGCRFMGGHFSPEVLKQMKLLAVEEGTTTQALLDEALNLLFVKKGKGRIIGVCVHTPMAISVHNIHRNEA